MQEKKESKFQVFAEVLPNNPRTAKILKDREEEAAKKAEKEAALKQKQDKDERERKKEKDRAVQEKARRDKAALENAKKEAEQQEESKRLDGKILIFLQKAYYDSTPREYSLAGTSLGGPRMQIVSRIVAYNKSLTTLHLCRKNIQDKEGQDIARALLSNTSLRKLELEGNSLGMLTARVFALALRKNKTLRYLDLESNNLTNDTEENGGVEEMIQALASNTTLLSLNLANNRLDQQIGRQFVDLFDPRQHHQ